MSHFWNCISDSIENQAHKLFEKLGSLIFDKPLGFLLTGFVLSGLMGLGLINRTFSNDIIELYTPQETTEEYPDQIYNEYTTSKRLFGDSLGSTLMLILCTKASETNNILTTDALNEAYNIWNTIYSINALISENDITNNCTFTAVCEKQYPSSDDCTSQTNNFFAMAFTNTSTNQIDPLLWHNNDINKAIQNAPDKVSSFIGGNGQCLLFTYLLSSYDSSNSVQNEFINAWIQFWSQRHSDFELFNIDYFGPNSFETETLHMLQNNVKLLVIAIVLLLLYMMAMYGKLSLVYSRSWVAFGGLISILLSIMAGFGLASAANYPFTVYTFLVPFIVFGVGIDIMIHTLDTFNNIPLGDNDRQRFVKLLSEIGYLISISTLTTVLAFSFGCVVEMTGVRTFCVFALCCFIWNYINFWLIILPIMVYDNRRIGNNRNGVICCMESNTSSKEEKRLPYISQILNVCVIKYCLNKRNMRYAIILFFIIGLSLSAVSISKTNTTSDITDFLSKDSYLNGFYSAYQQKFNGVGLTEIDIIVQNVDLSDMEIRDSFNDLFVEIENNTNVVSNTNEWLSDFELFVMNDLGINQGLDGLSDSDSFYLALQQWTNSSQNSPNNWGKEIIYDNPSNPTQIKATRFFVLIFENNNNAMQIRKEYMELINSYDYGKHGSAFVFNLDWARLYFDFVVLSYTEAIMIFSAVGMFFILWLFIDLRVMFVMIVNVIFINVNLFGWINLCDLRLDSMTFISCLMSVGFTIDYILYITYIISKNEWKIENDNYLLIIITSLCRSAFTTWVALLPLAFADNDGFVQFFIMFSGIILIALCHSVLFTVAICVELNLCFEYMSDNKGKTDISNLTATVHMSEIANKHKQTKTPSIELGANVVEIDADFDDPPPKVRRKASSIDIYDVSPIITEPRQEEPATPDEQLGVKRDGSKAVKYTIKVEEA